MNAMHFQTDSRRYNFRTAEHASGALENINAHLTAFLAAVTPDFEAALRVGGRYILSDELQYLRETISEHFRAQCADAFEASGEHFDADPMAEREAA